MTLGNLLSLSELQSPGQKKGEGRFPSQQALMVGTEGKRVGPLPTAGGGGAEEGGQVLPVGGPRREMGCEEACLPPFDVHNCSPGEQRGHSGTWSGYRAGEF